MTYTYKYPRPALTVDCIIFRKFKKNINVLLIQRNSPPFEGKWALPGGFIDINERLIDAAKRELKEETCLENIDIRQFFTFDKIDRDPRGRTISVVFTGIINGMSPPIKAASDARNVGWFEIKNIPELAFDHEEIMEFVIKSLKLK
jgi:8-oxo-dGTP diphosphatase